jgi:glycosyltransferase involved in cell wall biosynthesis
MSPQTSVGRIWRHVLDGLGALGAAVVVEEPGRRWRAAKVDVWLTDGHQGPLAVRQPVVAHLHEATWADPALRPLFEPWFLDTYEAPSAAAAAAATRIVTVSEVSKAQIVAAYGRAADDVDVVHNGLDHRVYRPDLEPPGELIEAAGGDPARPYVLYVSVVHPRKNLPVLRDAMAALAERGFPHALVLVAGPAADREDSAALSAGAVAPIPGVATPVVNLAGADDAVVARLMAGAAAFCLPSLMEGFGMAVAEAMACGAPVLVSDRGAMPEVVGDAGVVTPPTVEAVTTALADVLGDPVWAAQLRRHGIERAAEFTWEATARGVLASLERAVSGAGR